MTYTDEHLSAYLDGQLNRADSKALEATLETNMELAERLASLAEANEAVKAAYSAEIDAPIPEHILALLAPQSSPEISVNTVHNPVSLSNWRKKLELSKWAAPLAASLAMMFGLTVGRGMTLAANEHGQETLYAQMTGVIAPDNPLHKILETSPSATNVILGKDNNLEIKPILTFTADNGRYCREFKTQTQNAAAHGVACRQGTVWHVLMLNQTGRSQENGYRTASGGSDVAIDQFIDGLLVGAPMDAEAEAQIIRKKWQ